MVGNHLSRYQTSMASSLEYLDRVMMMMMNWMTTTMVWLDLLCFHQHSVLCELPLAVDAVMGQSKRCH